MCNNAIICPKLLQVKAEWFIKGDQWIVMMRQLKYMQEIILYLLRDLNVSFFFFEGKLSAVSNFQLTNSDNEELYWKKGLFH